MLELVTVFVRRNVFWSFTASVPDERLDELDPTIQRILRSLVVGEPKAPQT